MQLKEVTTRQSGFTAVCVVEENGQTDVAKVIIPWEKFSPELQEQFTELVKTELQASPQ